MAEAVYILCAVTSIACAVMLLRGYSRTKASFLLWSSLCFIGLAINNALLFVDLVLYAGVDLNFLGVGLVIWRSVAALIGLILLLFGLVWDAE